MLTIKVKGPHGTATLSLEACSTFRDLLQALEKQWPALRQPEKDRDDRVLFDVLAGYPPKALSLRGEETISAHIRNNDNIRLQWKAISAASAASATASASASVSASASDSTTATAVSKKKVPRKAAAATSTSTSSSSSGFGSRIATLAGKSGSSSSSSSSSTNSSRKLVPFGSRIASLNSSSSSSSSFGKGGSRKKQSIRRVSAADSAGNEMDISVHLMEAASGGTGTRNKILRKVFRSAVEHQYNSAKALARLYAVYSGNYKIEENANARVLGTGEVKQIDVQFFRGAGSRSNFEETVDLIPEDALKALFVLALEDAEGGREVLKPMNLSKCSPRMFWSLVHHRGQNLIHSIKSMLEGIDDCEWLTERKRELTDKAKENLRQQKAKDDAAQRRRDNKQEQKNNNSKKRKAEDADDLDKNPANPKEILKSLLSKCTSDLTFSINDLSMVQSLTIIDVVPNEYYNDVVMALESSSMLTLALTPPAELHAVINNEETLSFDQIESWIESAKFSMLQYLWWAICGNGCEKLRLALKKLRLRGPSDMLMWKSSPNGLLQGLLKVDPSLTSLVCKWPKHISPEQFHVLNVDIVQWMIEMSSKILSNFSFVKNYVELFEDDDEEPDEGEPSAIDDTWQTSRDAQIWLGRRCRIIVSELFTQLEGSTESVFFWEDGTIEAYLPPDLDEPMALWKVRLDSNSCSRSPRYEDLEEDEIKNGMARLPPE